MNYIACIAPLLLPVLFWASYHYHKDRYLPEPVGHLLLSFFLGIAAAYLGKLFYVSLDLVGLRFDALVLAETSMLALLAYAVLVIGVVEEIAKLIPFLLVVLRFKKFDEPIDGIIYASFIALGFATVENIGYLPLLTTAENMARGFAGPLVHIMFASIWGYHIGMTFIRGKSLLPTIVAAVGVTILLHGIYDFVVLAFPAPALPIAAVLILAIWIWRMRLIRNLHAATLDRKSS
jgi:RsiW-degrading membrane proteinase PrsW (M82 family)